MGFDFDKFHEFDLTEGEKHFRRLAQANERGEPPPADTLNFMARAGREILSGANPRKALKLERPKGNNKMDSFEAIKRIKIVQVISGLMDEYDFSKDEAIKRVAETCSGKKGYSSSSIKRCYDTYQRLARETNAAEKKFADLINRQQTTDPQNMILIFGDGHQKNSI